MKRVVTTLAGIGLVVLAGCQSEQPATQEQAQKLGESCQAYGFKPGTEQFALCIFQLDQQRIASNRQRRMAIGAALAQTGANMQANARTQMMVNAMNRPVNCTSRRSYSGGPVYTSCY